MAEQHTNKRQRYHKYKRGQFVIVRFGEGTGNEFSGTHPAIVLNKNDNPYNGVLTVVPLSSKPHKHYLELGEILDKNIYNLLMLSMKEHLSSNIDVIKILKKYNTDEELKNDEYQTVKILEKIHKVEPPGLKEDYKKFVQLYNKYNSMLTNSYAVITNIVTISKYKIVKPINDLDPLKNLVVQTSILNKIDSEIITRYTHHFD